MLYLKFYWPSSAVCVCAFCRASFQWSCAAFSKSQDVSCGTVLSKLARQWAFDLVPLEGQIGWYISVVSAWLAELVGGIGTHPHTGFLILMCLENSASINSTFASLILTY